MTTSEEPALPSTSLRDSERSEWGSTRHFGALFIRLLKGHDEDAASRGCQLLSPLRRVGNLLLKILLHLGFHIRGRLWKLFRMLNELKGRTDGSPPAL